MMQLDKIDMTDPATVAAVVAIGVLGLGMCIQLVLLFATLLVSKKTPPARKSARARKPSSRMDDHVVPEQKKRTTPRTPTRSKAAAADIVSPTRRDPRAPHAGEAMMMTRRDTPLRALRVVVVYRECYSRTARAPRSDYRYRSPPSSSPESVALVPHSILRWS